MPGQEKDWLAVSDKVMRHIRGGKPASISKIDQLALGLVEAFDRYAEEENWGPLAGQRRAAIAKWLGPDMLALIEYEHDPYQEWQDVAEQTGFLSDD